MIEHDTYTGEWFYNGKWHDHYPSAEMDRDDAAREDVIDEKIGAGEIDGNHNRLR